MGWYTDDTVEFALDHNAVVDAINGNGVISGWACNDHLKIQKWIASPPVMGTPIDINPTEAILIGNF